MRYKKDIHAGLALCFLIAFTIGSLFWTVRLAQAWDTKVGKMISQIDVLMEKVYGVAVPKKQ